MPNNDYNHWKPVCGLPLTCSFSAPKFKWILDNIPEVQEAAKKNNVCFGTIDSWIIYVSKVFNIIY